MLNKKVKILLISDYLMVFGPGMLGPLFAIFAEQIGGDILDISWVWATYLIVMGVMIMLVGRISDHRISKEKLVVAGFALSALFTFGYLLISKPAHLFIVQIALGIAGALSFPTWDALFARYENRREAGYNWGLVDGGEQLIPGLAILIGGFTVHYFGFKTLFIIMGITQILATISQIRILKK